MKTHCILICVFLLLGVSQSAQALRCARQLVEVGDHQQNVIDICGEPGWTQVWHRDNIREVGIAGDSGERRRIRNTHYYREYVAIETTIEEWIYDFGPRRLKQRILFENGYVVNISPLIN